MVEMFLGLAVVLVYEIICYYVGKTIKFDETRRKWNNTAFLWGTALLLSFNAKDYIFSAINVFVITIVTIFVFISLRKRNVKGLELKMFLLYCSLMILAFLIMVFVRKLTYLI